MTYDCDLFVIGAGSGGLAASKKAASYGVKVVIAESDLVGGTCVIRGCVPKKLMVYSSHFPSLFESAVGYGWKIEESQLDWEKFITSINKEVQRLSAIHSNLLQKAGVKLLPYRATLIDEHTVEVGNQKVTADKILIAVGGEAIKPNIPGIEHAITSREIFNLPFLPKHIAIIGAGYIGTEFACIMRGLGCKVTQIIRKEQILSGFDKDIRAWIQDGMINHGIRILTNSMVTSVKKIEDRLEINVSGKYTESITTDVLLVATGRSPNIKGLGLENAGVDLVASSIEKPGYKSINAISVNEYSQTSQSNIFAIGDVTNKINLTPVAIGKGRAFADSEFGNNPSVFSHENIPTAVFSKPEAATIGLTEAQAREKFGENGITIYCSRFRPMFYVLPNQNEKTIIKLVIDRKTDKVLGAHMVGDNAAEIIQGVAIAIKMGATKKDFDTTVGIHPSSAEEIVNMQ
ncbi:Glutathione reductase [Richelia intracellularis HH01]|uniref:Glutathione reductase n=1 Tax=Richelia intracellularis HH01 TaxID=1165094 RepID=M1X672_9NOST|nr:glutathione-disulfide reductase [Richelia intracellularis]CCH67941.1 Glutathione reductase [Richelia intracellularis HH01]